MEDAMKTSKILAIGLIVSATAAACSSSQRALSTAERPLTGIKQASGLDLQKIESNYLTCLSSGNSGVVESALGQLIYLRVAFPKGDLRETETRLLDLATRGRTLAIRQRAYVAMRVFADPEAFKKSIEAKHVTSDEILADLMQRFER